jgi:transposase-like protein
MNNASNRANRPMSFLHCPSSKQRLFGSARSGIARSLRVASDLNIGENALREWVQRAKIDSGDGPAGALTTDEREEFMRLRREHKRMLDGFGNPKKSGGILREKKPVRFIFIHRESECFPITALCRVLRVSCSGYHAWLSRVPCARKVEDQRLAVEITAVFMRSRKTYGSPRIYVDLASRGTHAGRNRIARIMQILRLCAREKRSFKCTTDSRTTQRIAPNVLARLFTAAAPNRKWVTDVKAIRTSEGWMYLAAVIDLFSRRIVGHAMSESNDTSLALQALNNAKSARGRSNLYTDRLCALHMQPSNERKG